jgi:hypothetical protein
MPFDYEHTSGPFVRVGGAAPALIELRQVTDDRFAVLESFEYRRDGASPLLVDKTRLGRTNLASIPTWLGWFMRRHGRHTAAALMHDQEVGESSDLEVPFETRRAADERFRLALRASGVPPVRARLMWTAVTFATRQGTRTGTAEDARRRALVELWIILALAGIGVLVYGCATGNAVIILLALLGPFFGAFLWGSQYGAGVIAGYALPLVIGGSIPGIVAYHVYWLVEHVLSWWSKEAPPTFMQR